MQALLTWLSARRHRLIAVALVLTFVLPIITLPLFVFDSRARGAFASGQAALAALAGAALIALLLSGSVGASVLVPGVCIGIGIGLGALLGWSRSLVLTFQGALLALIAVVSLITLVMPSAATLADPVRSELLMFMEAIGATPAQLQAMREWPAVLLNSLMLSGATMLIMGGLMLGSAWYAMTDKEVSFGAEFRGLKLGRVLGIAFMVVLIAGMLTDVALIDYFAAMSVVGFLFQGLAVLHAWSFAKRWNVAVLALVYVSLITPLSGVAVMGLSATGLIDNFFALRAPLKG